MRLPLVAFMVLVGLLAGCGGDDERATEGAGSGRDARVGTVPDAALEVMDKDAYVNARWTYRVQDVGADEPTLAAADGVMVVLGSTTKLFTIGSLYEKLGPKHTISTPVYRVGDELVLVAQGDIAMGGRGAIDGEFRSAPIDKVYANAIPGASVPKGDPLAGLRSLARQVADAGVENVADVKIDDRLFQPFDTGGTGGGAVTPIVVNDNQVDIVMTPTEPGQPVDVEIRPDPGLYDIAVDVKTVKGSGDGEGAGQDLDLTPGDDPNSLTVSGTLEAGADPAVRSFIPPDTARFARALFVEALERAGVAVAAAPGAPNDLGGLPAVDAYPKDDEVASLTSPPIEKLGSMILTTSYNQGADAMLCLIALADKSDDCLDGLKTVNGLVERAGIEPASVAIVDGHGSDPGSATPRAVNEWLQWTTERPWGDVLEAGLPVLGETGSLALSGTDSPARGKVAAKTGTSVHPIPPEGRLFVNTQGLAGFLDTADGKKVFAVYVNGGMFDDILPGLFAVGDDVADVAAAFQQHGE